MEKILGFINLHEKLKKVINLQFLACGKRDFLRSNYYPKRALIKGGFYSEGTDAFVISSNRRTLLFS